MDRECVFTGGAEIAISSRENTRAEIADRSARAHGRRTLGRKTKREITVSRSSHAARVAAS